MAQHTAPDASAIRETKVVLLGASGVGKTCIAERFINREVSVTMPTIGAAYLKRTYSTAKGLFEFQVWDTAGQENTSCSIFYRSLAPMYYRETSAVVIVFDLTNPTTFESAKQWVKEFRISGPDNAVMILAGNKVDLTTERAIGDDLANAYAEEIGAFYIETSAIADINIEKIFVTIAENLQEVVSPRKSYRIPTQSKIQGAYPTSGQTDHGSNRSRNGSSSCC